MDRLSKLLIFVTIIGLTFGKELPPACQVFCKGKLLEVVQLSGIYEDSKTFVDMKMKVPIDEVMKRFNNMMKEWNDKPTKQVVRRFVRNSFSSPGSEYRRHTPIDWVEEPLYLKRIFDKKLRAWAKELNGLWRRLGRKSSPDVRLNPDMYSIIEVPNPIIIPGDRCREFMYWDSFWIIVGLIRSDMFTTAKGMLENFIFLVKKYGYVPHGGRIYYLPRSGMPLLTSMVWLYYSATKDTPFLQLNADTLEKEFQYWMKNNMVKIKTGKNNEVELAHYTPKDTNPRPESYTYDKVMVESDGKAKSSEQHSKVYSEMKAAGESGWDSSSRWQRDLESGFRYSDTITTDIIPVDLNAVLYVNAHILSQVYGLVDEKQKSNHYKDISNKIEKAVTEVLWNVSEGSWFDYDMVKKVQRRSFYVSNLYPLWAGCFDESKKTKLITDVIEYLKNNQLLEFDGGVPSSLKASGQQWDLPNAFPPMQYILVTGLADVGDLEAKEIAYQLSLKWIRSNYASYLTSNAMYNKYDAHRFGTTGKPGMTPPLIGYGWTNGVCIDFLYRYGSVLDSEGISKSAQRIPIFIFEIVIILLNTCLANQ